MQGGGKGQRAPPERRDVDGEGSLGENFLLSF